MHGSVTVEAVESTGTSSVGISATLAREWLETWCMTDLQWVQYEANHTPHLWKQVAHHIRGHLCALWANGVLQGVTRKEAFFVRCDHTTMTQTDIENGLLICEVGVAPVEPAEFVLFRISLRLRFHQ